MSSSASDGRYRSHEQRRQGGNLQPQNHQRFVAKQQTPTISSSSAQQQKISSTASRPRPRLIDPLRRISYSSSSSLSETGGIRRVKFVNYLPQDEALASGLGIDKVGMDALESQSLVDILNDQLSWLLKLGPRDFWKEVVTNESLCDSLDSYLLFRSRWYDLPHRGTNGVVAGVIVGENELSRRMFMTFYRMSSNKDPGSHTRDSLSAKEHGALLQEKNLLDLPKLLDICGIYGHDNVELTRVLVNNAVEVQPSVAEKLTGTCHHFLELADTMHQRCISSVEVFIASGTPSSSTGFQNDLLEVVDFINDAIMTLDAFVDIYKPAAISFSLPMECSDGHLDLLTMLRRLHDSLFPSLDKVFAFVSSSRRDKNSNDVEVTRTSLSLKLLSTRIVNFGWKLLEMCYLNDEFVEDVRNLGSMKMFPVKIDDPVMRGDILVQTFREVNEGLYTQNAVKKYETFLQNIEKNFCLLSRIDSLRSNGWLFMDDESFQYLVQVIMFSGKSISNKKLQVSSLGSKTPINEDDVIMESRISQINDLFPEYGKGFLSACLDVYSQNPEEVIQRILEGTLHEDLLSLDTSLEEMPLFKTASSNINDKGKRVMIESETGSRIEKGKGVLPESPSRYTAVIPVVPPVCDVAGVGSSLSSASLAGRYTRKSRNGPTSSEILDSKSAKDSVRSMVLAAGECLDEYEDEYDDSFDDLGLNIVESGTEELEDKTSIITSERNPNKKPQFYVKDGKNYSYKVVGSIAAANAREASVVGQAQREQIHGLGRGGNIPSGATKKFIESRNFQDSDETIHEEPHPSNESGSSSSRGSWRGRRGGSQYRKNQAMKKHFAGLTGF